MINLFKIVLAIVLILCVADMPYGFYSIVRILAVIGFGVFAFDALKQNKMALAILYAGLLLLFQPFEKIALGSVLWNIVDVLVAVGLVASIMWERNR